jgi:hypothetical protein
LLIIAAMASCAPRRWPVAECAFFDRSPSTMVPPVLIDLTPFKRFRNYLGVTRVGPVGHHFTVWYRSFERNLVRVRVERDAAGRPVIEPEGANEDVGADPPATAPAMPPDVAALAVDTEAELRSRCPSATGWKIQYGGWNRTVTAQESIPYDERTGTSRAGWYAKVKLAVDESLTQVLDVVELWSAFGQFEYPVSTQWIEVPASEVGRLSLGGRNTSALAMPITEAVRRQVAGQPGPTLDSVNPADDSLLPPGFVPRVSVVVSLSPHRRTTDNELIAVLDLREAVFGAGAAAEAAVTLDHVGYRLHATLTLPAQRASAPGRTRDKHTAMLVLRLENDRGATWEHAYRATGDLELDGDMVIAPYGLELRGADTPAPAYEELHGQLADGTSSGGVHFSVDPSLFDDPRR